MSKPNFMISKFTKGYLSRIYKNFSVPRVLLKVPQFSWYQQINVKIEFHNTQNPRNDSHPSRTGTSFLFQPVPPYPPALQCFLGSRKAMLKLNFPNLKTKEIILIASLHIFLTTFYSSIPTSPFPWNFNFHGSGKSFHYLENSRNDTCLEPIHFFNSHFPPKKASILVVHVNQCRSSFSIPPNSKKGYQFHISTFELKNYCFLFPALRPRPRCQNFHNYEKSNCTT